MMLSIKNKASLIAPLRFLLRFKKKLTFIGIMGNTQGVINAAKPKPMPFKKINHQGVFVSLSVFSGVLVSATDVLTSVDACAFIVSFIGVLAVFVLVSKVVFSTEEVAACSILSENFLAGGEVHLSS